MRAVILRRRISPIVFFASVWILVCGAWCPQRHSASVPPRSFPPSTAIESIPITTQVTSLGAKKSKGGNSGEEDVVTLLYSHHLLDHKPDNMILKGGKHKLRGVACLGRPGVALCIGPPKSIHKFKSSLESAMPQKRFKTKVLEDVNDGDNFDGFESVSQGELRKSLASIGKESEFFALTGIAPEIATGGGTRVANDGGQTNKKKRKRK